MILFPKSILLKKRSSFDASTFGSLTPTFEKAHIFLNFVQNFSLALTLQQPSLLFLNVSFHTWFSPLEYFGLDLPWFITLLPPLYLIYVFDAGLFRERTFFGFWLMDAGGNVLEWDNQRTKFAISGILPVAFLIVACVFPYPVLLVLSIMSVLSFLNQVYLLRETHNEDEDFAKKRQENSMFFFLFFYTALYFPAVSTSAKLVFADPNSDYHLPILGGLLMPAYTQTVIGGLLMPVYVLLPLYKLGRSAFSIRAAVKAERLPPLSMTVPHLTYKEGLTTIRKKALESKLNEVTPTHLRPDQKLTCDSYAYKAAVSAVLVSPYEQNYWFWKIFSLLEKTTLTFVVLAINKGLAPPKYAAGVSGAGWLLCLLFRPHWDWKEDFIDLLSRLTIFATCLVPALIDHQEFTHKHTGWTLTGDEYWLAPALTGLAFGTLFILVFALGPLGMIRRAQKMFLGARSKSKRNEKILEGNVTSYKQADTIKDWEFEALPEEIKDLYEERFPLSLKFRFKTKLDRALYLLNLFGEDAVLKVEHDDMAGISEEQFADFTWALKAKLMEKFRPIIPTKQQVDSITNEEFLEFSETIQIKLIRNFPYSLLFRFESKLERAMTLLEDVGKDAVSHLTEEDVKDISKEQFEEFYLPLKAELLGKFSKHSFDYVKNLSRTLLLLKYQGEAAIKHLSKADLREIPEKEFDKLPEDIQDKLLERFVIEEEEEEGSKLPEPVTTTKPVQPPADAPPLFGEPTFFFEFLQNVQRTMFLLKYEEEAAIQFLTEADAAEITKEGFDGLSDKLRMELLKTFRTFGFSNVERTVAFFQLDAIEALNWFKSPKNIVNLEADYKEIPRVAFGMFEQDIQKKLLERTQNFEHKVCGFSHEEWTMALLRIDGEHGVNNIMNEEDAMKIEDYEFEELSENVQVSLLRKFRKEYERSEFTGKEIVDKKFGRTLKRHRDNPYIAIDPKDSRGEAYSVLKTSICSDSSEVRRAYRKLALKYHQNDATTKSQSAEAREEFDQITAAYKLLTESSEKIQKYDHGMCKVALGVMTADDANSITRKEFEKFDEELRVQLIKTFEDEDVFHELGPCKLSKHDRTILFLTVDGEDMAKQDHHNEEAYGNAYVSKVTADMAKSISKEEFDRFSEKTRGNLAMKFGPTELAKHREGQSLLVRGKSFAKDEGKMPDDPADEWRAPFPEEIHMKQALTREKWGAGAEQLREYTRQVLTCLPENKFYSNSLKYAVKEWCANRKLAEAKYRHITSWDVSDVTDMEGLFGGEKEFNDDISRWNVAKVENMSNMFYEAEKFNQDISRWNVGCCRNMNAMFNEARSFNQNLSAWNVQNVENMADMFMDAEKFNESLVGWKFPKCTDMTKMFENATSFNGNLKSWNVYNVKSMVCMFYKATSFEGKGLQAWNVEKCDAMIRMFDAAEKLNRKVVKNWDLSWCHSGSMFDEGVEGWETMKWMKLGKFGNTTLKAAIREWGNYRKAAETKYGHIKGWDVSEVTSMNGLFKNNIKFREDISRWNVEKVTDMNVKDNNMFKGAENFDEVRIMNWVKVPSTMADSLGKLRVAGWVKGDKFHSHDLKVAVGYWCDNRSAALEKYGHIEDWNTSEVRSMDYLFSTWREAGGIGSLARRFNDDISRWNVSKVESMDSMFYEAASFEQDLHAWDISNVKNMEFMFGKAASFDKGTIINWNLGGKNSDNMFKGTK
ncbi:hypothetical protein TL16_g03676 [Triparma laevis f. inornata]|uniref:J domain-containing protein n=1 Tax=Triparma laevis f. inornata TaxID=1714386 RepID=A0A9W6ZZN7_9STRA|nr:hypothetical protein TL16_g03676 [Triparma laevis f. inornata]